MGLLRESEIDPRSPDGPMAVIVETVIGNPHYGEDRAIEMIRDAQRILAQHAPTPEAAIANTEEYHKLIRQAISLLGLTRVVRKG